MPHMETTKKQIKELLPEVEFPRRMSTAWCAAAFEELAAAVDFIEAGIDLMTPSQRQVWERYKLQTAQFAEDMLLVEGNLNAAIRRVGLEAPKV